MSKVLRMPTSNLNAKGDYTISVSLGSEAVKLKLILDTGSSTLAVHSALYQPSADQHLSATTLVQEVIYGLGGWAGPVAQTSMQLHGDVSVQLTDNYVALATSDNPPFAKADGILGLAYKRLNQATDIAEYLHQQSPPQNLSLPWPFAQCGVSQLQDINNILQHYPKQQLTPWFTNIEQHGVVANSFAFYCKRSSIHFPSSNENDAITDPLNQGWFILGGGTEQTDLYDGEFQSIDVLHDVYYNVELLSIQVENGAPISCPAGKRADAANGFFDTGASALLLPESIYQQIVQQMGEYNPALNSLLAQIPAFNGTEQGLPAHLIDISQWPTLYFSFAGTYGNTVKLACPPNDYWQVNAPAFGLCSFKIIPQLAHFADQSIIGLPLLCNYYTVFDRTEHQTGVIRIAKAKR
jgi:hypothetical protein